MLLSQFKKNKKLFLCFLFGLVIQWLQYCLAALNTLKQREGGGIFFFLGGGGGGGGAGSNNNKWQSGTRMTASVLKQVPNTQQIKKNAVY